VKRIIGLAFALVLLGAAPALAHVSVNPRELEAGSFAKLTFRVPNESDTASTVSLQVVFPEAAPFERVSVKPTPGWTHAVEQSDAAVVSITWEGGEIGPGEFQEFDISVGPVPDVDKLEFKAIQTYSDGEVVRWIDPVIEGEDPEHPAPTATVTGGDDGDADEPAADGDEGVEADGEAASAAADVDPDDDAENGTDPVAFLSLLVGGVALVAAIAALVMARQRVPK
jgi:periplasmic copper chaperone A